MSNCKRDLDQLLVAMDLLSQNFLMEKPLAAKKRIDEALEALRVGLTPYVLQKMEGTFGKNWRSRASRVARDDDGPALDVYALLKIVRDNWHDVFSAEAKLRKARNFIFLALDARNNASHFAGTMEQREALRYLDAILELLRATGAKLQEEIVLKLYSEQQTGIAAPTHFAVRHSASSPQFNDPIALSQTQADRIRHFAFEHYVTRARRDGLGEVSIRAGDIHREMGLASALPAVCNAIGGRRFAEMAKVTLSHREGPLNGANVYFRFNLDGHALPEQTRAASLRPYPKAALPVVTDTPNLNGALILVSCVRLKLADAAPARKLYTSPLFTGVRDYVEASGARSFVLSSLYGLVSPDTVIEPYDYTLNDLGIAERKAWAKKVLENLLPELGGFDRVVMFAGARYREFLIGPLERQGISVEVPMEHLRQGEQLAWLSQHR